MISRWTLLGLSALLLSGTAMAEDGNAQTGKELYSSKLCNSCHTLAGESGPMASLGGSLDGIGSKRDAAWIAAYLKNPVDKIPESKMPKSELTDQEIADLTAYLLAN